MITRERLQRLQDLFHKAAELPVDQQEAFLKASCEGDATLLNDVLGMLEEDRRESSLLDGDLASAASFLLGSENFSFERSPEFGPYRIEKLLGEGGMGVVYLARRDDLQNFVAIKFLRDAWLSPARRERFEAEQRTLSQLNHPYIARLYDAGILGNGTPWFVMEYVDGVPVTEYCRKHDCSIQQRLKLFRTVCEAVQYAHGLAVIHRDLKPSNILVKEDGTPRLLDFGIAKQMTSIDTGPEQTVTELRLMTPAYAAPEQIRGQSVGVFTDVYALGLILYELLSDHSPFNLKDLTPAEALQRVTETEPEKPSLAAPRSKAVSKDAWADLDTLCMTAIQKDPKRRYQSVEALIRDIDRHLNGRPLEARLDSFAYRAGKFIRRNRTSLLAAAAVYLLVIGLTVFFTIRLANSRSAALAAAARTQRVQRFTLRLFEPDSKDLPPAETINVLTLVDRGAREAKTLNREPEMQAELYQTLGGIYQKLGKLDRADDLLQSALTQRTALLGASHPETAASLVDLGLLRVDQARYDDADRLIREGIKKTQSARPVDKEALAKATFALGKVLEARGNYPQAIPLLEQAAKLQTDAKAPVPDVAATLKELADANFYAGHYDLCDSLTNQALAMHREFYGEKNPLVADDLINLGAVEAERGRYLEAEQFYRQALAINQAWYGEDHPETASNIYMLGEALLWEKRFDESERLLRQALAIQERVYGPANPHVANVLNELCTAQLIHDQLREAGACYDRVLKIYQTAYGGRHYRVGLGLANRASVYLAAKDYLHAEQGFRDAIAHYQQVLPANHLYIGIAQIKLGRTLLREKRFKEAEEHSLAGYRIVKAQTSPSVSWLQSARKDLAEIYDHAGQPQKAAQFR